MATAPIQIRRSINTAVPASLANGEIAYTSNGGILTIGDPSTGSVVSIAGLRTPGTLTANQALVANSTLGINQIITSNIVAQYISANGSYGTAGQILISGGTTAAAYWAPTGSLGVNTAAQYTWSNTQTFQNTITFGSNLVINTAAITWVGNTTTSPTLSWANTGALSLGNTTISGAPSITVSNTLGTSVVNSNLITTPALNAAGQVNAASLFATGNLQIGTVGVTNGILVTNTTITIGNSTINAVANSIGVLVSAGSSYSGGNATSDYIVAPTGNLVATASSLVLSNTTAAVTTANLTGVYTTGVVNGATLSVGSSFVANSTTLAFTGANLYATAANASLQNLVISGNLVVSGSVVSLSAQSLVVNDNIIELGLNNTTTDAVDTGLFSPAGNSTSVWYSGLARIASKSSNSNPWFWVFASNTNPNTATTIEQTANSSTGTLQAYLAPYGTGGPFIANSTVINITANSTLSSTIAANTLTLSNALSATSGGTGKNAYAAGDLVYAATANPTSLTSLGVGANGTVLQIVNNLPVYGTIDGGTF